MLKTMSNPSITIIIIWVITVSILLEVNITIALFTYKTYQVKHNHYFTSILGYVYFINENFKNTNLPTSIFDEDGSVLGTNSLYRCLTHQHNPKNQTQKAL